MYSEDNASAKEVLRLIKNWVGYRAITSLPYAKGVMICKIIRKDSLTILRHYEKNYDAVQAMKMTGWHPDPKLSTVLNPPFNKFGFGFKDSEIENAQITSFKIRKRMNAIIYDLKKVGKEFLMNPQELHHLDIFLETFLKKLVIIEEKTDAKRETFKSA